MEFWRWVTQGVLKQELTRLQRCNIVTQSFKTFNTFLHFTLNTAIHYNPQFLIPNPLSLILNP